MAETQTAENGLDEIFPVGTSSDGVWLRVMHFHDGWVVNRFDPDLQFVAQGHGDDLIAALRALQIRH